MSAVPDTLPARLQERARNAPHVVALRHKDFGIWNEYTWSDYAYRVAACAAHLEELGVGPGDSVAILADNRPEWLYADLAAQSLGARSVGIYQTNPPEDVAYVLTDSGSSVLFCEDQEQFDKAVETRAQTPKVGHVIVFDERGTDAEQDDRHQTWKQFYEVGKKALADRGDGWWADKLQTLDPEAPAMVIYTSGTTGPPKGAMLSSRNVLLTTDKFVESIGVTAKDVVLSYLPLCHVAEKIFSVFLPMGSGAVVHFGESIDTVTQDLREVSPTVFLGVPRIWEKMHASVTLKMEDSSWLKRSLYRWATRHGQRIAEPPAKRRGPLDWLTWKAGDALVLRALQERLGMRRCWLPISGAAPISADLLRWFHGIGVPICEGFGMTECSGISHYNPPGQQKLGTVGVPGPLIEHRIAEDGEVLLRGPNVFVGYLGRPDATESAIDAEGWLHTGDLGTIDDDGYLSIVGRKKEIIITAGGKNLSPEKIENALKTSPYVKEAVAIGDARKYIGALVQIEFDTVGEWATKRQVPYTSFEDLTSKPEVIDLIEKEVQKANDLLARVEQVRKVKLLPVELHQDDGNLTPTQKVKRRAIAEEFAELIEALYR